MNNTLKKIIFGLGIIVFIVIVLKILKFALAIIFPIAVVILVAYIIYTKFLKRKN